MPARFVLPILTVALATTVAAASPDEEFFTAKVLPVLEARCFECHSHAAGKMKGGLTLDSRSGWESGGTNGPAVVPGDPEASLLVRMVRWADEDHRMPPREPLPAEEAGLLEEWVRRGAPDPRQAVVPVAAAGDWWSLRPLERPPVPGPGHPVDAFIRARLAAQGLTPSPPAEPRTLARRLAIDLTGLPPSEADLAAASGNDAAWEAQVERLLASPHHGERWARHWLDAIHFADTHGFEHDVKREQAWRYRDYVIAALNADRPWDRFIREQLAADVVFPDEPALTAALGFLGAGPYDMSAAGTAVTSFEYLDRDDLVTQVMSSFASTTANCARCHAHKFDPITQEDYYALQAVFAGVGKGDLTYDETAETAAARRRWETIRDAAARNDAALLLRPEHEAMVREWEAGRPAAASWRVLRPEVFTAGEGVVLMRQDDGALLASGARPDKDAVSVTAAAPQGEVQAVRLELLPHPSLPAGGPGRPDNGNVHVSEVEIALYRREAAAPERLQVARTAADFEQEGFAAAGATDGNPQTSWAIHPQEGKPHALVVELAAPVRSGPEDRLLITVRQLQGGGHLLGHFRLAVSEGRGAALNVLPAVVAEALAVLPPARTPAQAAAVAAHVLAARAAAELAALPPQVSVWAAGRAARNERGLVTIAEPRPIRVLRRGELDKPGAEVSPGALTAVTALPARFPLPDPRDEGARRAALADWLSDPHNPLTWRSIVNRVWHHHFGRGLCDTPGDFGRMGGVPSHPELLDWLAAWFRDDAKGSLKALHRLILTSAAWRQSSQHRPEAAAVDPDNRLLWRMNRQRLDADSFRDAVLAVSGRLDPAMGGPGVEHFVKSPGPQATPKLDYAAYDWAAPGSGRRSIYRVVWRGIADPFMEALDFPELGLPVATRGFSVSGLQALALLNNPFVLQHSAALAARAGSAAADDAGRVRAACRFVLGREPSAAEAEAWGRVASRHGLPAVCRALLNSSEFLFIE